METKKEEIKMKLLIDSKYIAGTQSATVIMFLLTFLLGKIGALIGIIALLVMAQRQSRVYQWLYKYWGQKK